MSPVPYISVEIDGGGGGNRGTASSTVTTTITPQGTIRHDVTTTISTRLFGSTRFAWWIDNGQIQIDFNDNSLLGVLLRGGITTLAEEMINVTRDINPDYLSGRTLGGMQADVILHWTGFVFDDSQDLINFERWDFVARIGGLCPHMPGFDNNAWFFESAYAAYVAARLYPLAQPWGGASLGYDFMRYLSFRRS